MSLRLPLITRMMGHADESGLPITDQPTAPTRPQTPGGLRRMLGKTADVLAELGERGGYAHAAGIPTVPQDTRDTR